MSSESLVDLVTTVFGANLAITVVFTGGYIASGLPASASLDHIGKKVLLPSLLFTTLAGSSFLTAARLVQIAWPSLLIALVAHLPGLLYSYLGRRFFSSPGWIAQSTVYNNALSFPLLALFALKAISDEQRGLGHLRWRVFDTIQGATERGAVYLVLNYAIVQTARTLIAPVVERVSPSREQLVEDDLDVPTPTHPVDEEDATESTPLVPKPAAIPTRFALRQSLLSPASVAFVLGLLVALIKPVQRGLTGITADYPSGGWVWQSVGLGLWTLGAAWVVLDIVRFGASVREAEPNHDGPVPPTLGTVLTLSIWRYVLVPLFTLPLIHALTKIPSTKFFLQDPVFPLALALPLIAPPTSFPTINRSAFQSNVLFATFYTSLITALPLALAIAWAGRGVRYETDFDLARALKSAAGGGLAGAAAMVVQVLTLMPLRTVMNYQYRYGGSLKGSVKTLYREGGFKRYYAGLAAALFQGPFARFGDTAANAGIIALLSSLTWPVLVKTIAASVASACFRMVLTPIDTLKTTQQTNGGKAGLKLLRERVREKGVGCLWYGALATAAATFVGHYPWFATYNSLQDALPIGHTLFQKLLRQAFIGFAASVVSDTISNSLRVVKTYRQVHEGDVGYVTAAKEIIAAEGVLGLFGRGLGTRLLTNGLQGLLFSILWKYFGDLFAGRR
ncbi:mitochondrial carrier domain-containing protein [Papiliotrema laurentii]|uniref:Mitochondrial carrier domain-containing protein n=1 Tax=Papiliotrema laurentii TaxID=5418 RepID=A0AAD9FR27_PAPLA|nr:mitochondrial carrier domain-containing protein [Papiliotrema laurentii]